MSESLELKNELPRRKKLRKTSANAQVSHSEFATHHPDTIFASDNVNRELYNLLGDLDPQMVPVEELVVVKNEEGKPKVLPKLDRPVDKWVWH